MPEYIIRARDPKLPSEVWTNLCDIPGSKLAFSTPYHPQTDRLAERIMQTMEDIISRLFAYLAYTTSQPSNTRKTPSLIEKGCNHLLPLDHLKKNFLKIDPTAKEFHELWKKSWDTAARFIAEAKEYNKQRYDKSHKEPAFSNKDQVIVSTLDFNNLKGHKKMKDSFVAPFTIKRMQGKSNLQLETKSSPPGILEAEESSVPVRKISLHGKDHRKYLVRLDNKMADKDKWIEF
ncbi:hypothetical protein O181_025027 [Austropuccinia psidii MF-1]|uniref:Integrase catalytic domain-containing protein n=1 Tax=Austropuccinia psidii MF-1 TaxID=1389203 RepID=A0A9Q3CMP2_9BASI|nr:hypothetical protein [Austropuccinia psidii MF-1]